MLTQAKYSSQVISQLIRLVIYWPIMKVNLITVTVLLTWCVSVFLLCYSKKPN